MQSITHPCLYLIKDIEEIFWIKFTIHYSPKHRAMEQWHRLVIKTTNIYVEQLQNALEVQSVWTVENNSNLR